MNAATGSGFGAMRGPLVGAPCPSRPWQSEHPYFSNSFFPFSTLRAVSAAEAGAVAGVCGAACCPSVAAAHRTVIPTTAKMRGLLISLGFGLWALGFGIWALGFGSHLSRLHDHVNQR